MPAVFVVNGKRYQLDPRRVGLRMDEEGLVDKAMAMRRAEGIVDRFREWVWGFTDPIDMDPELALDAQAVDQELDAWESDAIPNPAFSGGVEIVDHEVMPQYPRAGQALDRERAAELVYATLTQVDRPDTELPVVAATPSLTDADVDAAVDEVRRIIDEPVTLRSADSGFLITFERFHLEEAVKVVVEDRPPSISVVLDDQYIGALLVPNRSEFEIQPVDASYNIDLETDEIRIIPGRSGTLMDLPGVVAALHSAALGSGFGPFPVLEGAQPEFTTEAAQAFFADIGYVSEFSTPHPCCQPRVTNIHLIADAVDGVIVLPGADFSLNEHVGQRTAAKGYLEDCAIVGFEVVCEGSSANIGGGVSQFATTFFNALFFGCYEIIEHQPHSLYFNRYPMGREATLGYPKPDVIFRNNTDTPVIIKTKYTDGEITVKLYGNLEGKECTDETSERTNIVEFESVLVADAPEEGEEDDWEPLKPGEHEVVQEGKNGFTVTVTRIVRLADGTIIREEPFVWRYRALQEKTAVHPCEITGEFVDCPVPLPSLVGNDYQDALQTLDDLGLTVVRIDEEVDDPDDIGTVLAMDPAPGEYLAPGSSVTLTVGIPAPGGDDQEP
jgi:vancomycin resistance protein YoaR